jgi:hypothetical protein
MATRKPDASAAPAAQDTEQMVTDLARVFARLAVKSAIGNGAATFGQIIVNELHIATHEEASRIEAWLTSHGS